MNEVMLDVIVMGVLLVVFFIAWLKAQSDNNLAARHHLEAQRKGRQMLADIERRRRIRAESPLRKDEEDHDG